MARPHPLPPSLSAEPEPAGWRSVRLKRYRAGEAGGASAERAIAHERPVAFVYNEVPYTVMMATPADLEDFALGFSLAEGILKRQGEFGGVTVVEQPIGAELRIAIPERRQRLLEARPRNMAGRTGCGLCGIQSLSQALRPLPMLPDGQPRVAAGTVLKAVGALQDWQPLHSLVHAVHGAAWCSLDGTVRLLREDVGRHNALDKMIGARARGGDDGPGFALVTSRLSVEMVQKVASVGIAILVAVSAPTTLALEQAESAGVTLIASARPDSLQLYTHPERLDEE